MSKRLPVDETQRQIIRTKKGATLFVAAGAGSGKTRELVQRIVRLVADGVALPRIAAITFTNAAAAELRDRVRLELEHAGAGGERYEHFNGEQRTNCRAALETIDAAAIQTLHSFAQRILGLYPIEAGLPPEVSVRDEVGASIAFEDRWEPFIEDLLKDGCGDPSLVTPLTRGFALGLTTAHLRKISLRFHQDWDRVLPARFEHWPMPGITAREVIAELTQAAELKAAIKAGCEEDAAFKRLGSLQDLLRDLGEAQQALDAAMDGDERLAAEDGVLRLLGRREKISISMKTGRATNWQPGRLGDLRECTARAEAARMDLVSEVRAACLGPLLTAIQRFVREYRDERVKQGTLEFHDMLYLARDLLIRNPEVRRRVAQRFDALLIDEFQDTDPIQVEIAVLVASDDSGAGEKPWSKVEVEPGRLFFVGDPKQSIYRFRRADIDLYGAAAQRFGAAPTGETVHLVQNFRSAPSVIAWSNHVFGELFGMGREQPEAGPATQVEFEGLETWREADDRTTVAVRLLGGPLPRKSPNPEAAELARLVSTIRREGEAGAGWRVQDGDESWRAPRFSDITILLPTRTTLPALEQALNEAAIPCRVESRSLLFETQEVRDLLTLLRAIDDPTDEVAVVAALRSPGFGCSDRDLWEYASAHGSWDYRRQPPEGYAADGIVAESMAALKDFNSRRWWLDPAEMIDLVIRERRLFQLAFAGRRPRESWQRLRFVHEQARAFGLAGGRGLRQFVTFMERQAEEQARLTETAIAEHDDDAVRIMTVHASKGLEFPIVILAGLNTGKSTDSPVVLWDEPGGLEVRVGSKDAYFETAGYALLKTREDAMERFEDDRLLYVAATRARDHLVVSVYHEGADKHHQRHARNDCRPAECLYQICTGAPELWLPALTGDAPVLVPVAPRNGRRDTATDREEWSEQRRTMIEANSRRPALAATSIARAVPHDSAAPEEKEEQLEEEAPWKKGRAGTSVGRAVHAVLQTIDLETGQGLEAAAAAQAIAEGVEGREPDILAFASAALESTAVKEAIGSGRFWREVYVSALVEGTAIEGFIDLLYETPEGLVVVDYKTDGLRDEAAIDEAMGRYRLQGAAYALALEEALERQVGRCVFVFVQPRQERVIEDLAGAMDDVRHAIPAALAGSRAVSGAAADTSPA